MLKLINLKQLLSHKIYILRNRNLYKYERLFICTTNHKMAINKYHIFFGNLANPLKIDIISALKEKPKSVTELIKDLKVEQSKLSHALASLRCCSIVDAKQEGKNRIYQLNKETILPMLNLIDKHEVKFCKKCKALSKHS